MVTSSAPGGSHTDPSSCAAWSSVRVPARRRPGLITSTGRVPIELELTRPSAERLSACMSGYAAQSNIRGVLYMIDDRDIARIIETTAAHLGLSALIHLQRVSTRAADLA
jgi:hypothetical protein